jgi:hypothetical protein
MSQLTAARVKGHATIKKLEAKAAAGKALSIWSTVKDRALYAKASKLSGKPLSEIIRVLVRGYADGSLKPRELRLVAKAPVKPVKPKAKPSKPKAVNPVTSVASAAVALHPAGTGTAP